MASIFQRLFKIGQSQTHAALDKLEDPIRMTEQGIRDLKHDLQASMSSLAEVKSFTLRLKKELDDNKALASDYERKAMLLLQRMQKGEVAKEEAERLATEALKRKEECSQKAARLAKDWEAKDNMASPPPGKI